VSNLKPRPDRNDFRLVALNDSGPLIVLGSEAPLPRAFDLAGASLWAVAR
jgi:hypothetical protein